MQTSTPFKLIVLFALSVVTVAVQWRMLSQLRLENKGLPALRVSLEESKKDVTEAERKLETKMVELNSSRAEVSKLQGRLQEVQQESEKAKDAAKEAAETAAKFRPGRSLNRGGATPTLPVPVSSQDGSSASSHLRPGVITNPPANAPQSFFTFTYGARVGDVEFETRMSEEIVRTGPTWNPSQPLPLDYAAGEAIARGELGKLIDNESEWRLRSVYLMRSSTPFDGWHMAYRFDQPKGNDVIIPISLSGVPGIVGQRSPR